MADKIKKSKSKKIAKKDDWDDFEDDDLEGLDGLDFSAEIGKDKRAPAKAGIAKDFLKGAGAGFKGSIVKNMAKKSLPQEFDTYSSELSDLSYFASETYDASKAKLKRPIARIAKDVKKFLPESFTKINKLVDKAIESTDEQRAQEVNEEAARTSQITNELGGIFDKQLEVQKALAAQSDAQADADRKISLTNAKKTQDLLTDISASSSTQTSFSLQIAKEYYKKSLELQFRSYYVQADMLRSIKEHYPVFKTQLDGVIKNTGLPDFVKIKMDEKYFEVARTQMLQKINTDMFSNSAFIKNMKKNLTSVVNSRVGTVVSALEGMADALSGINDLADMNSERSKLGTVVDLAGGLAGSTLAERVSGWLGGKIRPHLQKSKTLNIAKNSIAAYAINPQAFLANMKETLSGKKTDLENKLIAEPKAGIWRKLKMKAGAFAAGVGEDVAGLTGRPVLDKELDKESILTVKTPAIFDQQVHRSIVHVIPTYLSHILRQSTRVANQIASSQEVDLLEYNYNKRTLQKAKDVGISYAKFLEKKSGLDKAGQAASNIMGSLDTSKMNTNDKKDTTKSIEEYIVKVVEASGGAPVTHEDLFGTTTNPAVLKLRKDMPHIQKAIDMAQDQIAKNDSVKIRLQSATKMITTSSCADEIRGLFNKVQSVGDGLGLDTSRSGLDGVNKLDLTDQDCAIIQFSLQKHLVDDGGALTIHQLPKAFRYVSGPDLLVKKITLMLSVVKASAGLSEFKFNYNAQIQVELAKLSKRLFESVKLDPDLIRTIYTLNPGIFEYDKISSDAMINMNFSTKGNDKITLTDYSERTAASIMTISDETKASLTDVSTEELFGMNMRKKLEAVGATVREALVVSQKTVNVFKDLKAASGDTDKQAAILKTAMDSVAGTMMATSKKIRDKVSKGFDSLGDYLTDVSEAGVQKLINKLDDNIKDIKELILAKEKEKEASRAMEAEINKAAAQALPGSGVSARSFLGDIADTEIVALEKGLKALTRVRDALHQTLLMKDLSTVNVTKRVKKLYDNVRSAITTHLSTFKEAWDEYKASMDANKEKAQIASKAVQAAVNAAEAGKPKA
jgi:hypothetical protein